MLFKDENVNEDTLTILQTFHFYLPRLANGQNDGQIFTGDQLTLERAVNVIASVANGLETDWRLARCCQTSFGKVDDICNYGEK